MSSYLDYFYTVHNLKTTEFEIQKSTMNLGPVNRIKTTSETWDILGSRKFWFGLRIGVCTILFPHNYTHSKQTAKNHDHSVPHVRLLDDGHLFGLLLKI